MDAFTFILGQFWVSLEINKCGVPRLFRDNAKGAKYPHNATSHVSFPRNVSRKYDHAWKSPKMAQKQSTLKDIIHALDFPRARAPKAMDTS